MRKSGKKRTATRLQAILLSTTLVTGLFAGQGLTLPTKICATAEKADASQLANPTVDKATNLATWDCIWFGQYYQSDASGKSKDPIKWKVLSIDGDDAFLLADKALEQMPYCEGTVLDPEPDKWGYIKKEIQADAVYWENCTIRSFMNGYGEDENVTKLDYTTDNFIDVAFTKEEQDAILTTTVNPDENTDKHSPQGEATEDKLFLLSTIEVNNAEYGFIDANAKRYYNTPNYTFAGGRSGERGKVGVSQEMGYSWWTRTSGQEYSGKYLYPVSVGLYGEVELQGGYADSAGCGMRPAMHLDLKKAEGLWKYAGTVSSDGTEDEENGSSPAVSTSPTESVKPENTETPVVTATPKPTNNNVGETTAPEQTNTPAKTKAPLQSTPPLKTKAPEPPNTPANTLAPEATQFPVITATPYSNNNTLPILNIEIDESKGTIADMNSDYSHEAKCYGTIQFSIPDNYTYEYGKGEMDPTKRISMQMNGRGNASFSAGDKKPYKLKLDAKADLFGMGANKHWVLINATNADFTYMKNKLLYDLAANMGMKYVMQSVFVDVVMNGEYVGNYLLCEHVRVGKTRINIDDIDEAKPGDTDTLTGGLSHQQR